MPYSAKLASGLLVVLTLSGCSFASALDARVAPERTASPAPTPAPTIGPEDPDDANGNDAEGNGFERPLASTVDQSTPPSFLQVPMTAADALPGDLASEFELDPADIRFQGEWKGVGYYLAVRGASSVQVVMNTPGGWGATGSEGNSVIANADQNGRLRWQYLPQGTATVPDGWTALSGSMIVR